MITWKYYLNHRTVKVIFKQEEVIREAFAEEFILKHFRFLFWISLFKEKLTPPKFPLKDFASGK